MKDYTYQKITNILELFQRAVRFYDKAIEDVVEEGSLAVIIKVRDAHQCSIRHLKEWLDNPEVLQEGKITQMQREALTMIRLARDNLIEVRQRHAEVMGRLSRNPALHFVVGLEEVEDLLLKSLDQLIDSDYEFGQANLANAEQEMAQITHDRVKELRDDLLEDAEKTVNSNVITSD